MTDLVRLERAVRQSRDPAAMMALIRLQARENRSADAMRFVETYGMQPLVSVTGELINPFEALAIAIDRPGRSGLFRGPDTQRRQRAWSESGFGADHLGWYTSDAQRHVKPIDLFYVPDSGPFDYEPAVFGHLDESGRAWTITRSAMGKQLFGPQESTQRRAKEIAAELDIDPLQNWRPIHVQLMNEILTEMGDDAWRRLYPRREQSHWTWAYQLASYTLALLQGETEGIVVESTEVPIKPMVRLSRASPIHLWICSEHQWQQSEDCLLFALMPSRGDLGADTGLRLSSDRFDMFVETFGVGWSPQDDNPRYQQRVSEPWQEVISHPSVWLPGEQVQYLGQQVERLVDAGAQIETLNIGRSSNAAFLMADLELVDPIPLPRLREAANASLESQDGENLVKRVVLYAIPDALSPQWQPCVPLSALMRRIESLSEGEDVPAWDALRKAAAAAKHREQEVILGEDKGRPEKVKSLAEQLLPWASVFYRNYTEPVFHEPVFDTPVSIRLYDSGQLVEYYADVLSRELMRNLGPYSDLQALLDR